MSSAPATKIRSKRTLSKVWEPIDDLPSEFGSLSDGELSPLLHVWNDLRAELQETGGLERYRGQLEREWAIETGQIEGIYDIDRGVTQTLIERGISADLIPHTPGQRKPELIAAILFDHAYVLDGLFQFVKVKEGCPRVTSTKFTQRSSSIRLLQLRLINSVMFLKLSS